MWSISDHKLTDGQIEFNIANNNNNDDNNNKGAWAYRWTAQSFKVPPIISGMGKAKLATIQRSKQQALTDTIFQDCI